MSLVQGPLGAMLGLAVLVWLGMGISVATLLRRAGVPAARATVISLAMWPLVLRRLRQLQATPGHGPDAPAEPDGGADAGR